MGHFIFFLILLTKVCGIQENRQFIPLENQNPIATEHTILLYNVGGSIQMNFQFSFRSSVHRKQLR